jgi:xylulokinase
MDAILVFDATQNRCRASYVARDGTVIASAQSPYITISMVDWVEQEPRDWFFSLYVALRVIKEQAPDVNPVAIALTGQARMFFLLGDDDRMDTALLEEDRRATLEWRAMVQQEGVERLIRSANIVHEDGSPLAKLLWLKKHQPTQYTNARTILFGAHDYLAFRLCGARVTDYTSASASDLFSLQADTWATDLLQSLDLRTDWLPDIVAPGTKVGELSAEMAESIKLTAGIPVYHGAADLATMMLGAGVRQSNEYFCYLGNSGWLGTTGLTQLADPITGLLNQRNPDRAQLLVAGQTLMAAGCFEWLKDKFGLPEEKLFEAEKLSTNDLFMTLAAEAAPGSGGVIFLPYLIGEQAPFRDPLARAGWFHISKRTFRSDLYRAVLEGVTYSLRAIQMLIPEPEHQGEVVLRLLGDDTCTPLWAQIFADVFNCRVDVLKPAGDVLARGAAFTVAKGLGWAEGDVPNAGWLPIEATYTPNMNSVEIYEKMFNIYYQLYPALRSSYAAMASKD